MDLKKVKDEEKLRLCRQYFLGGFGFLPFLWLVNTVWFFHQAFLRKPPFPQQPQIRKYVIASLIGCILWTVALTAWIVVYQNHRVSWGALGDYLSFVYPKGRE